jgi:two-component system nitrate/nitrite response regulator NarL
MLTVLLCSNEPILAEGLKSVLSRNGEFDLVSSCPSAEELRGQIELHQPDLLLVDLTADCTLGPLKELGSLMAHTGIVLWVHSISTEVALQAISLGFRGILRKTVPVETLRRCLLRVKEGELWFDKALTDSITSAKRHSLTRREGQLVVLLTEGLKNKEVATALGISEGTVKVYLSRLFAKLGVKDRFELAIYGLKNRVGAVELAATGSGERARSSVVNPPQSFFVERLPQLSNAARVALERRLESDLAASDAGPVGRGLHAYPAQPDPFTGQA